MTWSFEHDELLSNWGDHATCYTWMHDATRRKYSSINMFLGIPVIILSTLSGTANFGISAIFPPGFNYSNVVIGTLSIISAIISTIATFLGYAQAEESHRISSIQWSKFKRTVETELSLHPNERQDPGDFIKYAKSELDRLMEQSPMIPQEVIDLFIKTFKKIKNVKMPEICNKLEPTTVYSELYNTKITKKTDQSSITPPSPETFFPRSIKKITSIFIPKKKKPTNNVNTNTITNSNDSDITDVIINVKDSDENKNIINYSNSAPLPNVPPIVATPVTPPIKIPDTTVISRITPPTRSPPKPPIFS